MPCIWFEDRIGGTIVFFGAEPKERPNKRVPIRLSRRTDRHVLDRGNTVKYAQKQENTRFFSNVMTFFGLSSILVYHTSAFWGSEELTADFQRPHNLRDGGP